ncbi:MAG: polyribonucleotide nucleotidyltransferase [Chloroflexi bacterium]|nr:polyribonucleotide nucleotidyltransferase [Chloroflexota bacterium]
MARNYEVEVAGKRLVIETGELAEQAGGAVTLRYGDCVVLATACISPQPREGADFFPLTVDYEERLYAAGKIPGSFFRREGRPSQEATLAARLTDRPLRPLFPKGLRNDVQVIITILSVDKENPPDVLGIIGASTALSISEVPFGGPVAATRMGYLDNQFVVNPTFAQIQQGALELVVAGTRDAVVMVEAGAKEVPEEVVLEAIRRGQEINQVLIDLQNRMAAEIGKPKMAFTAPKGVEPTLEERVSGIARDRLAALIDRGEAKGERNAELRAIEEELVQKLGDTDGKAQVAEAFDALLKRVVRTKILDQGRRPDGRGPRDIRPISCQVGILPRTHGSGLFTRGQTQVLSIVTLGSMREEQRLDTLSPEDTKRFMHHYNFPPFSVGEVRRLGSPGRREVGHGALAERALAPVIPGEEEFPYTIRIVSEVLSSNGSTSMASVCGSTLALMDAGTPIKRPVAGVAMGLVMGDHGRFVVLSDIQGIEDFLGDMDFKVAGTAAGITALQMDIKMKGITLDVMRQALAQAQAGRLHILSRMTDTMPQTRSTLSPYAPRMVRITVPVDKIGAVIGPGGKTIRSIIEETGVTIDVADDGTITIGSVNGEASQRAISIIETLTREVEVGQTYKGKVTRLMNFGAFVEILPGKEGLVHISELAEERVTSVEDVVKVGDELEVKVVEIDRMGRINLSRRAVLLGESTPAHREERREPPRERMGPGGPPRHGFGEGGPPRGGRPNGSYRGERGRPGAPPTGGPGPRPGPR